MTPRRPQNRACLMCARLAFLAATVTVGAWGGTTLAADEDDADQPPPRRPGLIARVTAIERSFDRLSASPAIDDAHFAFDRRLDSSASYSVRWSGLLSIQADGPHQFFAMVAGRLRLAIDGQEILKQSSPTAAFHSAKPIDLEFGQHAIEVEFTKVDAKNALAKLSLFWSGPGFSVEPLTERHFSHEPAREPSRDFPRGEELVRALRCAACHAIPSEPPPLAAPALDKLAGNLKRDWLVDWIVSHDHGDAADTPSVDLAVRRMPAFRFSQDEAAAVADFLLTKGDATAPAPPPDKRPGDPRAGESLFHTLGCLACHRLGEIGSRALFDGGDLSRIAAKRPADFFVRWLTEPAKINRQHRMPVFEMSEPERDDLAAFLAGQGSGVRGQASEKKEAVPEKDVGKGRELFLRARCDACHVAPGSEKLRPFTGPRLGGNSNWDRGCSGAPEPTQLRPGYRLPAQDAAAVREFISQLPPSPTLRSPAADGQRRLVENNCVACHARDLSPGLAPALTGVAAAKPELAEFVSAMTPPSLASVGDKLRDAALVAAIQRSGGNRRPYLKVRMPKFALSDDDLNTIVQYLVATDRLPDEVVARGTTSKAEPASDATVIHAAGARLVTSDGFGCMSCHQVGKALPSKAPVNARGPDLSLLEKSIRREWFDRWCRDPGRIVPRIEMPAVKVAVRGVLGESVDQQLSAVWQVLNTPGFQPPEPTVQVLRRSGIAGQDNLAAVVTDIVQADGRTFVRPFLVGLPSRHNVLFDCESGRLARWSVGDVARQRTKGKSWFWEDASPNLLNDVHEPEFFLERNDQRLPPARRGQNLTEIDAWQHVNGGVRFTYRLRFDPPGQPPVWIRVSQTLSPIIDGPSSRGFRRTIAITGPSEPVVLRFRREHEFVRVSSGGAPFERDYVRDESDSAVLDPVPNAEYEPAVLQVAPGFQAIRLPLPAEQMPTALTWRPEGTLVVASLKGRIWLAKDSNGDGLEDRLIPFSDELAAPYGLAADKDFVDVCTKYAVLRLHDQNHDGIVERTELIASGWGYTDDYHDWTFGLPSDGHGGYYIALACQQDKRSEQAARLRGKVVQLVPREPTADNPRRFDLRVVSGGHRFPTGIARNRAGDLFVTDNQGNYNPFNELNHVLPGRRYGFINTSEQRPDFKPPVESAAIEIPHPWTRSVNGICFLETPDAVRLKLGHNLFGPYEGHLIGCEYDTRRLIRMSLQKIGDTFQGAAYPLTYDPPRPGSEMLGPICCAVSPEGDIYVGSIRDSGWGAGNNIGEIIRLRLNADELPPGIAEVRAVQDGFEIDFAAPVDRALAADVKNYSLSSYRRVSTPAYGGPDVDRRDERIVSIHVADDARRASIKLSELRPGFVYDIHLKNLTGAGKTFFPAEAYFTLRR